MQINSKNKHDQTEQKMFGALEALGALCFGSIRSQGLQVLHKSFSYKNTSNSKAIYCRRLDDFLIFCSE